MNKVLLAAILMAVTTGCLPKDKDYVSRFIISDYHDGIPYAVVFTTWQDCEAYREDYDGDAPVTHYCRSATPDEIEKVKSDRHNQ